MTDRDTLFSYRLKQAEETFADAERMLEGDFSPRTVINRSYYSMFYIILALFIKAGIDLKTSKHAGIISLFDKDFVHAGKLDTHYSKILHKMFDMRQESDYKELVQLSSKDSEECVKSAREFLEGIKKLITGIAAGGI